MDVIELKAPEAFKKLLKKGESGMLVSDFCAMVRKYDGYELPLNDLKSLKDGGVIEVYGSPLRVRYLKS